MDRRAAVLSVLAVAIVGCSGSETPTDSPSPTATQPEETGTPTATSTPVVTPSPTVAPTPTAEPTPDPRLCNPVLSLSPSDVTVAPYALLTFKATGGTGKYKFELSQNQSGAVINSLTGAYLAGSKPESTDVVSLTDTGCEGVATATVHIPKEMSLEPQLAEVDRGINFTFEVSGGSGEFRCNLLTNGSGATLDTYGCAYTAGTKDGVDVARVVDVATGQFLDSTITVKAGAVIKAVPSTIFLPEGARFKLKVQGGTGNYNLTPTGNAVEVVEGELQGLAEGDATVKAEDRFTHQLTNFKVRVVPPQRVTGLIKTGEKSNTGKVLSPGDLDGDGFKDVILALPEADAGATNGGGIYLYRGQEDGMAKTPAQVITGTKWDEWLGSDIALGDVDGDGLTDLTVGTYKANSSGDDRGSVSLYPGQSDGTFATTPSWTSFGISDGDLLGWAVTVCDFNGDGLLDIAASANQDEDNRISPAPSDQGSVHIFLNSLDDGLPDRATQVVYGGTFDANGAYINNSKARFGLATASGDFNGDGLCDLAVGTYEFDSNPANNTNDGAVFIHNGVAGDPEQAVTTIPTRAWTPVTEATNGSQLGRQLEVGDVNGDGFDDLLASQPRHRPQPANTNATGGVRLFLGSAWDDTPATAFLSAESSDWLAEGTDKDDYFGWSIKIDDASGDGIPDILSGNIDDELPSRTGTAGTVMWYKGAQGGLPSSTYTRAFSGLYANERFGQSMGVIDDLDGDGVPDLFVFSARGDTDGWEVGLPYYVLTRFEGAMESLELPVITAGELLSPVAFAGDFNGDGHPELVAGAPNADVYNSQFNAGAAWLYSGSSDGISAEPAQMFYGPAGYSENDNFGYSVASAGDFNHDGFGDFAVLSRLESRPSSFSSTDYANPTECNTAKAEVGAIFIYLGSSTGQLAARPAFIYYGPQEKNSLLTISGGFDYDGDGFDDLLGGSYVFNRDSTITDAGGFVLLRGRQAASGGLTTILCSADYQFIGNVKDDHVGISATSPGDLDNDGCDELAVGANGEDLGSGDQGSVRFFYGWGNKCKHSSAEGSVLVSGTGGAQGGIALGSGGDVDGDGKNDLAVGGSNLTINGSAVGAAWIVQASRLLSLSVSAFVDGQAPSQTAVFSGDQGDYRMEGSRVGELCGRSVGIVPGLGSSGRAVLAVGCPLSDLTGTTQAGGVYMFQFNTTPGDSYGLDPLPVAAFGGETDPAIGYLGDNFAVTSLDGGYFAVGGQRGDGPGADIGAVYVVPLKGL